MPLGRRTRTALAWAMGYGPAAAWVVFAIARYGPTRGYAPVLALALVAAVGVLGLTAVAIAYVPFLVERAGCRRLGAWLRTWWDEDAR